MSGPIGVERCAGLREWTSAPEQLAQGTKMANSSDGKGKAEAEMYFPPNNLAKAIGKGRGPSIRQMEQDAERRQKILAREYPKQLTASIKRMQDMVASGTNVVDKMEKIFVEAHDIKGQAGAFDYNLVSDIAICICSSIREAADILTEREDLLALHVNALEWAFAHEHDDSMAVEKSVLAQSLKDALAGK